MELLPAGCYKGTCAVLLSFQMTKKVLVKDVKIQIGLHKAVKVWRGDQLFYNGQLKASVKGRRGKTYTCKVTVTGVTRTYKVKMNTGAL